MSNHIHPTLFLVAVKISCNQLKEYKENPKNAKCSIGAEYIPPCDYVVEMKCWKLDGIEKRFSCEENMSIVLPRCGHEKKVTCNVAGSFSQWEGRKSDSIGMVHEGVQYGNLSRGMQ